MQILRIIIVAGLTLTGSESVFAAQQAFDHSHRQWSMVLQQSVHAGRVDYARLQRERRALDVYRGQLANVAESALASWSRGQQLAFWINAYNASVLATIVDHYPIARGSLVGVAFPANSIWQVPGAFKAKRHRLTGRLRSLDEVEHEILRPRFREPRIHMALVCAARSCPPLRGEPYIDAQLDQQLDQQTRSFLTDTAHGLRWSAESKRLEASSIFKWFESDFESGGGVRAFLSSHAADARLIAALRDPANKIRYLGYDWTLNDL